MTAQLERWRSATAAADSPAQLQLCLGHLDTSLAWEKSIMRARCQICRGEDNEACLLLCDSCDCGFHTYCFRPALARVPEGDWFCPACLSTAAERPLCLVCSRDAPQPSLRCATCRRHYHPNCTQASRNAVTAELAVSGGALFPASVAEDRKRSSNVAAAAVASTVPAVWLCFACTEPETSNGAPPADLAAPLTASQTPLPPSPLEEPPAESKESSSTEGTQQNGTEGAQRNGSARGGPGRGRGRGGRGRGRGRGAASTASTLTTNIVLLLLSSH